MLTFIIEKLSALVDMCGNLWHNLTSGKRGADDFSGFLWIVGIIMLITDMVVKGKVLLFFALLFLGYGIFRCFSNFTYHEQENLIFIGLFRWIWRGLKKAGIFIKEKAVKLGEDAKAAAQSEESKAEKETAAANNKEQAQTSYVRSEAEPKPEFKTEAQPQQEASKKPERILFRNSGKATTEKEEQPKDSGTGDTTVRPQEEKAAYYIFECPGCKKKVRIPNRGKKGRVAIVCPNCKTRFVRMRW